MIAAQSNFVFDINNYDILNVDKSEYQIITAIDKRTSKKVDIKLVRENKKKDGFFYNIYQGNLYNDACISQYLNLPGIVKLIGFRLPLTDEEKTATQNSNLKQDIDFTGFVSVFEHMEYCDSMSLVAKYLKSKGEKTPLNPTIINKIIFGTASIMKQIHNCNIVHEELTIKNIFLDENLEPHICYFCSAHFAASNKSLRVNSFLSYPQVQLPKSYNDIEKFSFQNDIYHFAALILSLFDLKSDRTIANISLLQNDDDFDKKIKKPENVPDAYWELIKKCAFPNDELMTFAQITEILKDDKFAFEQFGKKTNLEDLHEYQNRIDIKDPIDLPNDVVKYMYDKQFFS